MTKDETLFVATEFRKLVEKVDEDFFEKYKHYFDKNADINNFKDSILYYADAFEKSEGYDCAS
jgi:hypothetical protein